MKVILTIIFIGLIFQHSAQDYIMPIESSYKDRYFANKYNLNNGPLFPQTKSFKIDTTSIENREGSYLKRKFFSEHLVQISGENFALNISPMFDFSGGIGKLDSTRTKLYQNTRGIYAEGKLMDNFFFNTSFYENQARFSDYQTNFYNSVGEFYPIDSSFYQVNAVIPNAARTKPFKTGGFDYAYATGSFVFLPLKDLSISAGNTSKFLGFGHRSLFLSDNSAPAPFLQVQYDFLSKFQYTFLRMRLLDLYRLPFSSSDESYYTPKLMGINMLSYSPFKKLNISLIESSVWKSYDSLGRKVLSPFFYNPVPLLGLAEQNNSKRTSVFGLNTSYQLNEKNLIYAQLVLPANSFQVGLRSSKMFNQNLMLQIEYNEVKKTTYFQNGLNYSHYNLPLAHIRGENFREIIVRTSYEYERFVLNLKGVIYQSLTETTNNPMALRNDVKIIQADLAYRFNKKTNLQLFISGTYRVENTVGKDIILQLGIKTALRNFYTDF